MTKKTSSLLIIVSVLVLSIVLGQYQNSFAQSLESPAPTDGNAVDVLVEPTWNASADASFKVTFLEPGTDSARVHVDYDLVIMKGDKKVFSAAESTGQPVLHTAGGIVTVPYKFSENGDYSLKISVYGLDFTPIKPESVSFPVQVTPEFPAGMAAIAAAGMITVAILLAQRGKSRLGLGSA